MPTQTFNIIVQIILFRVLIEITTITEFEDSSLSNFQQSAQLPSNTSNSKFKICYNCGNVNQIDEPATLGNDTEHLLEIQAESKLNRRLFSYNDSRCDMLQICYHSWYVSARYLIDL
jgi:hypothetical protein